MDTSPQFTVDAGRTFRYQKGHRAYLDGGQDLGTPVPFTPEKRPEEAQQALILGIRVPAEMLVGRNTSKELLSVVLPHLSEPGKTYEARRAIEDRIGSMQLACYQRTGHQIICNFVCPKCNRRLGGQALRLGRDYYNQVMREAHEKSPGCLITVLRGVAAVCPHCGGRFVYTEERTLALLEDE
jgi:predicted RNA-binding Zn-ribbon protein involved in translation (DUF1610 family)